MSLPNSVLKLNANVPALGTMTVDVPIDNNITWYIGHYTFTTEDNKCTATIVWDPDDAENLEYLFNANDTCSIPEYKPLPGNGTKKLRLTVKNNDVSPTIIALNVYYEAYATI